MIFFLFLLERNTPILWKCIQFDTSRKKKGLGEQLNSLGSQLMQFAGQQPLTLGSEGRAVLNGKTMVTLFDLES